LLQVLIAFRKYLAETLLAVLERGDHAEDMATVPAMGLISLAFKHL
jgi:hypothetical protein